MAFPPLPTPIDVLIADDPCTRQAFRLILEARGYGCAEAADGREAVETALRLRPRCVLLDLAMPVMGGLAAARALRGEALTRSARIHCVSGSADPESRSQAREAGCESFLAKPVGAEELLAALPPPQVRHMRQAVGLGLAEAEALLDWLESGGCTGSRVEVSESEATVRYLWPPAARLEG